MTSCFPEAPGYGGVLRDGPGGTRLRVRLVGVMLVTALVVGVVSGPVGRAAPGESSLAEYEKRRAKLAGELADEHFTLGKWCQDEKLSQQAGDHFKEALRLKPEHEGAKAELGTVEKLPVRGRRVACRLHLTDGVQMNAELLSEVFWVDTGSGVLTIPVDQVDVVKVGKGEAADVIMAEGFVGRARIEDKDFTAKGKMGVVNVSRENVDYIRIMRPCAICDGTGIRPCPRCEGKGRLYGTATCQECGGTGKVQCVRCGGTGRVTCPNCGGGGWMPGMFGGFRFKCGRCNGRGTIDCSACKKGMATCPTCKGNPVREDKGPCPDCQGKKTVPCDVCAGTGIKPLPLDVEKEVMKVLEGTPNNQDGE